MTNRKKLTLAEGLAIFGVFLVIIGLWASLGWHAAIVAFGLFVLLVAGNMDTEKNENCCEQSEDAP